MKPKSKVKQSTEKPLVGEMRLINGNVMMWTGSRWIYEPSALKNAYKEVWNGKQG